MTEGARPLSRAEGMALAAFALAAAWCVARFAAFGLSMQFALDDWEWLGRSTRLRTLIEEQLSMRWEVFRPLPQHLYGLSRALFGLSPVPLAAVAVAAHLGAAWGAARTVRALDRPPWAAALVALTVLLDPVSVSSLGFFALNQVVLCRAFTLLALASLLERPRPGRWLPWALLAIFTHEQSVLLLPLWALCLVLRDGWRGAWRAARRPDGVVLLALVVGYAALRALLRDGDGALPHALGLRALPEKWSLFQTHVREFFWFRTGLRACTAVDHGGFMDERFHRVHWLLAEAWGAVLAAWLFIERGRALKTLAAGALWALGGYAPYFLAMNESGAYHFNLALVGLALPVGAAFVAVWERVRARSQVGSLAVIALAAATLLPLGRGYLSRPPVDVAQRLLPVLRPRLRAGRDGASHLIFLDGASRRGWGGATAYIAAMGGEWDLNRALPPDSGRSWALWLSLPDANVRVWLLREEHADYLCLREGDLALRVHARDINLPYAVRFTPLPTCALPEGLPAALDPATPTGAALTAALGPSAGDVLPRAREYWRAYRAGERDEALRLADALTSQRAALQLRASRREPIGLLLDAVEATVPPPPGTSALRY